MSGPPIIAAPWASYTRKQDKAYKLLLIGGLKHHNARVKGDILQPGQLVFCCDHNHRDRHKIQDHWSSVLYKVVRCPQDGGPIYTIVTADGKGHPKQIHRTELRPAPCFLSNTEIPDPGLPSDLLNEVDNYVSEIPFVLELLEPTWLHCPQEKWARNYMVMKPRPVRRWNDQDALNGPQPASIVTYITFPGLPCNIHNQFKSTYS